MGASQQKKTRQQQREEGIEKRQLAKKKAKTEAQKEKKRWTIIGVIVAFFVVLIIVFNAGVFHNYIPAVTIGDVSYSSSEYSFFYRSAYNSFYNQNYSMIQAGYVTIPELNKLGTVDYSEDMTWREFFREQALAQMKNVTMLYNEANAAGFTLNDDQKAELQSTLDSTKTVHESYGYQSANAYWATNYGSGLTVERVSKLIEREFIAAKYAESVNASFEYSADELAKQYKDNEENYDIFNYLSYTFSGAEDAENDISSETAMAEAKALADKVLSDDPIDEADTSPADDADTSTNDDSASDTSETDEAETTDNTAEPDENAASSGVENFKARVLALTGAEATAGSFNGAQLETYYTSYKEWLTDASRKEGDTTIIENETSYTVLCYVSRDDNDYNTVSARHILVKAVASEDGTYTDEAKAAAKTAIEEIQATWEAGEKTEDAFAALANEKSEDGGSNTTGGLYENIYHNQMVKEFNDFIFDENRKPGDTGIVLNDGSYYGYHLIYFVGTGMNYRDYLADTDLRNEAFTAWETEKLEGYPVKNGSTLFLVK